METGQKKKKRIAIAVAILALIATALGGTYAWTDYSQHKSNELNGESIKYEARLVEDFAEVKDWKVEDGAITKKISVANLGQAPDYGSVYVRIQLKEFMDISKLTYHETPDRYMIDTAGEFIVYANEADAIAATSAGGQYPNHEYTYLTDAVTGTTGYFIKTQDHDPNGQMGKYVVYDYTQGDPQAVISSGPQQRATSTNHESYPSDECNYAIHTWKAGTDLETRQYVEWLLNTGAIMTLSEWLDPNGNDGALVDKWIIDDIDPNNQGWVYWGHPLDPGSSTELFMESVRLIEQPEGSFYYVIHTDMEAVSIDELISGNVDWGDAGQNFIKKEPALRFDGAPATTVRVGETVDSPNVIATPDAVDPADLVWSSSNTGFATVDQNGKVTGIAVGGPITITVQAPNGTRAFYTLTVLPASTVTKPATGVTINDSDLTMNIGDEHQVDFTVQPSDTTDTPVWTSSDNSVATVDQNGKITAVGEGDAVITVTINGHSDTINVTVNGNSNELPLKPDGGDGYTPIRDTVNPMNGDGLYIKVFYPDRTDLTNNAFYHNGAIHLEDIIADGNYTGVTVTPTDAKYASYVTVGVDQHSKPSILFSYIPTEQEYRALVTALSSPDDDFYIPIQVQLTRDDGKSATVTINMYYWDSLITV